ncbi:MAG: hypothetical protein K8R69_02210 [Deltaproteobacteria bacterium]|nr:hypothetical protein [Deltaproteobacteria bacterium]
MFRGLFGTFRRRPVRRVGNPLKVEAKAPVNDAVIKPATLPPPAEGNRPTLPEGLKFPEAKVAMGETGLASPESLELDHPATSVMGEVYGKTHEGVGRDENEDGVAMAYTPERDLVIIASDGMGGHEKGKEATQILLDTMAEQVSKGVNVQDASQAANQNVMTKLYNPDHGSKQPGAGVLVLKVNRPSAAGAPSTMEAFWGSDLKLTLYREAPNGDASWIYCTLPDNVGRMMVDMGRSFGPKGEGRDLQHNSHERASYVDNTMGRPNFRMHGTEAGEVFDPIIGFRDAKGLDKIALEDGDVAIGGSDGLWKNVPDRNLLIEWTKGAKTAKEKAAIIDAKVRARMKIVSDADAKFESGEVPDTERIPFQLEGKDLFIDSRGRVWDRAKDGKHVDHYEADNFSIIVYVHNLKGGADFAKVDSKAGEIPKAPALPTVEATPANPPAEKKAEGPQPPSDTSLSDPDKTTEFKSPPKDVKKAPELVLDDEDVPTVVRPRPAGIGQP